MLEAKFPTMCSLSLQSIHLPKLLLSSFISDTYWVTCTLSVQDLSFSIIKQGVLRYPLSSISFFNFLFLH